MNKQRKVVITITYNEMGIIIDTKAEEVAQPNLQPTCNQLATDTISKQAAIKEFSCCELTPDGGIDANDAMDILNQLPPAQPEPHEGHWIPHESPDGGEQYECSRCGVLWEFNDGTPEDNEAYFCPKCGTKMKGERQK